MRSILGGTRCATSASATRLAVRARGAGAAGQDQVVDELALSNLIYGRSINQDFFAAFSCCLSNLCLMALAVQATMAIATRRRADDILLYAARYACTGRGRLHAVKFYRDMARERRGQSAAATRYVQRGPRAGVYALA